MNTRPEKSYEDMMLGLRKRELLGALFALGVFAIGVAIRFDVIYKEIPNVFGYVIMALGVFDYCLLHYYVFPMIKRKINERYGRE